MSASNPFRLSTPHLLLTARQRCCSDTRAVPWAAPNQKHDRRLADTQRKPSLLLHHALVLGPFGHCFHQLTATRTGILGFVPGASGKIHQVTNVDLKITLHVFPPPQKKTQTNKKPTAAINPAIFLFHCQISDNLQY